MRCKLLVPCWLLLTLLIGCKPAATPPKLDADTDSPEQAAVRQEFNRLKAAIAALKEGKDTDSVWDFLGAESQADAEREAKVVKAAYAKLADKDKVDLEKKMALSAKELADMNGKYYLKSQRFQSKHQKIPDSRVSKITITGETATLVFIEPDNNSVTATLVRQKAVPQQPLLDKWKFNLDIPKASE
jgi:hypothetical protein